MKAFCKKYFREIVVAGLTAVAASVSSEYVSSGLTAAIAIFSIFFAFVLKKGAK
jgi:hypothetical protein